MSADPKPSDSAREREIFLAALELSDLTERRAYLDSACGPDAALRQRVEALLREHEEGGSFMQTPAIAGPGDTQILAVTERPGDTIGRYKLLQQIGEGGCGIVYMAEQEQPVRRRVALKVIKLGMDTRSVIARFEAERQALAMMDHPNIARVFDAGATETGRPYFVMELVRGVRITEFCDENNLSTQERLELFILTCQAIQHAHQKGIIHRDIKPSNILVTLHDGKPVPKVIDFGIAKATEQRLTEKTLFTEFQSFMGTPAYTSPEQAEMSGLDIDTRSDIYSLGVLLYELLTGQTPFDPHRLFSSGLHEMRRIIREEEPVRPSTRLNTLGMAEATAITRSRQMGLPSLVQSLRGDLDWIVMKSLEKDRTRRYETANGLAQDIRRYLSDEPVLARPPSNLYRLQKLYRRHRGVVAATAAIAVTLILGIVVSLWHLVRATQAESDAVASQNEEKLQRKKAEDQREIAQRERAAARINEYVADINLAQQSLKDGNYGRAFQLLEKHRPRTGESDLRGFEWRYLWQICKGDAHEVFPSQDGEAKGGEVATVALSPNGEWLAVALWDKVNVWNVQSHTLVKTLPGGAGAVAFGANNQTLVIASLPGGRGRGGERGRGRGGMRGPDFDRRPDGRGRGEEGGREGRRGREGFGGLGFGRGLEPGRGPGDRGGPGVRVFRTSNWAEQSAWTPDLSNGFGPGQFLTAMALSGDGSRFAAGNWDRIIVCDTSTGSAVRGFTNATTVGTFAPVMVLSHDGKTLATDTSSGITLWPVEGTGREVLLANSTNVLGSGFGAPFLVNRALAISPDGRYVVAARNTLSERGVFVLSVWDAATGNELPGMPTDPEHIEHTGMITSLSFAPEGRTLASASRDFSVRLWDLETRQMRVPLQGHHTEVLTVAFASDGQSLVSGDRDGAVKRWLTNRPPTEEVLSGAVRPLGFSKDGHTLAVLTLTHSVAFYDATTRERLEEIPLEPVRFRGGFGNPGMRPGEGLALGGDLKTLVQSLDDGRVKIWNTETLESRTARISADTVGISPDGQWLLTSGRGQALRCWNLNSLTNVALPTDAMRFFFSPDGNTLAVFPPPYGGGSRGGQPPQRSQLDPAAQRTNVVQLWDFATLSLRTNVILDANSMQPFQGGTGAAFSPNGKLLATASFDEIQLWDTTTGFLVGSFIGHKQMVQTIAFSTDGRTLASAGDDSTLRFWNVATRQELLSERRLGGSLSELKFSPDGRLLVAARGFKTGLEGLRFHRAPLLNEIEPEGDAGQ